MSLAILLCLIAVSNVMSQTRGSAIKKDRNTADNRILDRQLAYAVSSEKNGNINSAYQAYSNLMKRYPAEIKVLTGFVDTSIKTGKIKECEISLKQLVNKHPVKQTFTDPSDDSSSYGIKLLGFIAELYFRTGRNPEGYEIITLIDSANTEKKFKKEIKAAVFMRSGYSEEAEKIYKELRKESGDENSYSEELFPIYLLQNKVEKFTDELIRSAEYKDKRPDSGKIKDAASFNPKAELLRLYEIGELRDSILMTAEKLFQKKGSKHTGLILSELYFSSNEYDKAFSVMKKLYDEKESRRLLTDFALKLYNSKEYEKASDFFELLYQNEGSSPDGELLRIYITCLENSSKFLSAENVIRESGIKNGDLMLAQMYHNHMGKLNESANLYKKNLTVNKSLSHYWRDYLNLMIAERKFNEAQDILSEILKGSIMDIFSSEPFFELKALEAELQLFSGNKEKFITLSEPLIRDDFFSDYDNDLLKIRKDLNIIGGDNDLLDKYLEVTACGIDISGGLRELEFVYEKEGDPEKKKLILETALRYHIFRNEKFEVIKLADYINGSGEMNNSFARLITGFSNKFHNDSDVRELLLALLKSGIDEEVKAEVRDLIREREPS